MDEIDAKRIEDLKELANGAALDPGYWQTFGAAIRDLVPEVKVFMHFTDTHTVRSYPAFAEGIGQDFLEAYVNHYDQVNPWTAINVRSPLMAPIWTEDSIPADTIRETEFYRDFLRHLGESDSATGIKLAHDEARFGQLSLHYGSKRAERVHQKVTPLLTAIAPTLQQSIRALRLRQNTVERDHFGSFVDTLVDPSFVLDRFGKVKVTNKAAERLLEDRKAISIERGDVLHLHDRSASAHVERVRQAMVMGENLVASVREPVLQIGASSYRLTVLQLSANLSTLWGLGEYWSRSVALLLTFVPIALDPNTQLARVRETFGLTMAEAELAMLLSSGVALPDAAEIRGVSYQTVRWQLKSIFQKTKVNRQSELVALLLRV